MNEAKDNEADVEQRKISVFVGDGVLKQSGAVDEPQLVKGDFRLQPTPLGEGFAPQKHEPLVPKRKLGHEEADKDGLVHKKSRVEESIDFRQHLSHSGQPDNDSITHPAADTTVTTTIRTTERPKGNETWNDDIGGDKQTRALASNDAEKTAPTKSTPVLLPPGDHGIRTFTEKDCLSGRGGATNVHRGNKKFRDLVDKHRQEYLASRIKDKQRITRDIVETIRRDGGRFLKRERDGFWYEIGDVAAREKAAQALRQKAAMMRMQNNISSPTAELQVEQGSSQQQIPPQLAIQSQVSVPPQEQKHPSQPAPMQQQPLQLLQRQHQDQMQQQLQLQLQQQLQQHQQQQRAAYATAASLGTVAIDPSALTANPLVLQQALANPVFRALLAMNKVVVPVVPTTVNTAAVPAAPGNSNGDGLQQMQQMGLAAPPALGDGGLTQNGAVNTNGVQAAPTANALPTAPSPASSDANAGQARSLPMGSSGLIRPSSAVAPSNETGTNGVPRAMQVINHQAPLSPAATLAEYNARQGTILALMGNESKSPPKPPNEP
jgi:hypothetical protein